MIQVKSSATWNTLFTRVDERLLRVAEREEAAADEARCDDGRPAASGLVFGEVDAVVGGLQAAGHLPGSRVIRLTRSAPG